MGTAPRFTALSEAAESLLGQLADEFIEAHHRNAPQDIEDMASRHPELADVIRQMFPAMLALRSPSVGTVAPDELLRGEELGDFLLLRQIGRGGMGIVYEAIQRSLGRRVALKVLPLAAILDDRHLRRFQNEARAAAILQHPHIVSIYGVGCERGVHYYAMQLIDGPSLAEVLLHEVPTPASDAAADPNASTEAYAALSTRGAKRGELYRAVARLGVQAAEALDYAHREGVIHRDIKPSNLLLDRHGKLWIADFGLARIQSGGDLTHTGDVLGTLRYMSPEQFTDNKIVDHRTDVYSLGLTLYEMLARRPAFDSAPREQLIHKILNEDSTPLRKLDAAIPVDLETIVLKAVNKEPGDRYATAGELALDLVRYLDNRPIRARRLSLVELWTRWARRHQALAWSAGAMVMLALILVSVAWRAESARRQQAVQTAHELSHQLYTSKVTLAQEAIEHDRVTEAVAHLVSCPEALRGWEWHYLLQQTKQNRKTLYPNDYRVSFVQFSPDGRWFLTAGHDGKLTVWNAITEQLAWSWRSIHVEPGWGLYCATFSPDSQTIAVGDDGGYATLLDVATGAPLYEVQTGGAVRSIAFSPDGEDFVTGGGTGIVAVFRASDGETRWRDVNPLSLQTYSVEYHPNGQEIATSGTPESPVRIWDAKSGSLLRQFVDPHPKQTFGDVCCVRYSRDGTFLVSAGDDRTLKLWKNDTGELLRTEIGHTNWIRWLEFSPDGQWIATASRDSTIGIWQANNLELLTKLRGHKEYVYCLGWSPDGKSLISCSNGEDHSVMLWDAMQGPSERRLAGEAALLRVYPREDSVNALAISRAPRILCAGHQGGAITAWNLDSGQELANLVTPDEVEVSAIAITPDAKRIVAGKANGRIDVWDLHWTDANELVDQQLARSVRLGIQTKIHAIELNPKTNLCLAALSDGSVAAMDAKNWETRYRIAAHAGNCRAVTTVPATDQFATCGDDGEILLWDTATGDARGTFANGPDGVNQLGVSGDGRFLVSSQATGQIIIWDIESRLPAHTVQSTGQMTSARAFHPSEPRFAAIGAEGAITLWDCEVGQGVLGLRAKPELRLCGREAFATSFSPDGNYFAAGMEDGSIRVWESQEPSAELVRQRHAVNNAAHKVDSLKLESLSYAEVVARLKTGQNSTAGDRQRALAIAIARCPQDPVVARNAARTPEVMRILGGDAPTDAELRQALQECDAARIKSPDDVWLLLLTAWAHARLSESDKAYQLLLRADELSLQHQESSNPAVLAAMACVLTQQGDVPKAKIELARAAELKSWPMWSDSREIGTIESFVQTAQAMVKEAAAK